LTLESLPLRRDLQQQIRGKERQFLQLLACTSIADMEAYSEAWRYTGPFTRYNRLVKGSFPGLGIATGAFAAYLAYEALFLKDDHHGGDHH
jgi:NADH dehydrogenase (ubiquinone) 1 beta subcomplex subunit 3